VLAEMKTHGLPQELGQKLLKMTNVQGDNEEKISALRKSLKQSKALDRLTEILENLSHLTNLVFDPSLARGLEYYTGFFFECFLEKSAITSSLVGTGRYDRMIGQYLNGKQDFAAVGISFGVSVICDALREKNSELKRSLTQAYVVAVSPAERKYAIKIARQLREAGIKTDMDLLERGIGKNFSYADALGIPFVVVVGEKEQSDNTATVKNMKTGEQKILPLDEVIAIVR